ncbi:MAG: enoyl-CoA hydratase-related protein [Actinomycetota bacterium]
MADDLLVVRSGGVVTVTLNRPERLNAMSLSMVEHLHDVLRTLSADPDARVVVLTGSGRAFCAGGDVSDLVISGAGAGSGVGVDDGSAGLGGLAETIRACTRVVEILHGMPKPVIAAVNGPCAGAGLSLACACDVRVASSGALFTTAFVGVGQSGDYGLAWTLPRIVGTGRARELFFTGRRVGADEALRLGLVEEVCSGDELGARVTALADEIAGRAPLTLAALKANLADGEVLGLGAFLDREAQRYEANARTEDATEAALAYLQKRAPVFRGR